MSNARTLASYASSFPSFRNKLINGNFDIWQRGTSQTSAGYGSADRWENQTTGSANTLSQQALTIGQTEVPGNPKYYLRSVVTSVVGNGNGAILSQKIEDVRTLSGKTATLSFWAKADSNKSIATEFAQYFGGGSSFNTSIGVTTHNLTTSWQKFTATVLIPSISGKTIGSAGTENLSLFFWFEAGSDYNSRTNSLGQPNNGTTYEVDIAQVQVEEGTVATPFEHRPISVELSLAQRYYQQIDFKWNNGGTYTGTGWYYTNIPFITQMRADPTLTASAYKSNTGDATTIQSGGSVVNGWTLVFASTNQVNVRGGNDNIYYAIEGRAKLSAEL